MRHARLWPLLLGTSFTLGLGAPIAKAAAQHGVGALAFALWPTLCAGLVLASLGLLRQGRPPDLPRLLRFGAIAGLFGHALPMSALFWLAAHAGAGFASLSLALPPVFTLLVAMLVRVEPFALRRAVAVGVGLGGALLMMSGRGGAFAPDAAVLAIALAIPASIGAANVYRSLHMPPGASGEWMSAVTLLASSTILGLVGLAGGSAALPTTPVALGWLTLQAGLLVVGYLMYFALQRRAEPVTFSFIGYLMMLFGVAAGSLVFGERLPWTVWPAAALVLAALRLLQRPTPPPSPARSPRSEGAPV